MDNKEFIEGIINDMWDAIGAIYVHERSDAAKIIIEVIQKIELLE